MGEAALGAEEGGMCPEPSSGPCVRGSVGWVCGGGGNRDQSGDRLWELSAAMRVQAVGRASPPPVAALSLPGFLLFPTGSPTPLLPLCPPVDPRACW